MQIPGRPTIYSPNREVGLRFSPNRWVFRMSTLPGEFKYTSIAVSNFRDIAFFRKTFFRMESNASRAASGNAGIIPPFIPPGASPNAQNIQQLQRELNDLRADLVNARSWIQNLALRVPPEVLANNLWESVPRHPAPGGSVGSNIDGPSKGGGDSRTSTVSGPAFTNPSCAHLGTDVLAPLAAYREMDANFS